ncbi:MAG: TrkA family potassium uptake protein, partial [Blastochloris sp.]|nr:TrkA family potassium uptake protein [Blastochloris sp.]
GVERARGLIAALGDDKDNVFLVLSARSLNPHLRIVARLNEDENEEKLYRAGADEIVSPNIIGGVRLASVMVRPSLVSFLDGMLQVTGQRLSMAEIAVHRIPSLVDKSLSDAGIGQRIGLLVLAIKSASGAYEFNPKGRTVLREGDTLVVMGTPEQLEALHAIEVG